MNELYKILLDVEKNFTSADTAEAIILDMVANQSKWISVETELPEETEKGVKVIAVIDNTKAKQRVYGNVCELIYFKGKFHVGFNKGYIQNDVTHGQYQPTFP